ncbi:hypothetical protein AB3S75_044311 [Citrus x aurantiifolia]
MASLSSQFLLFLCFIFLVNGSVNSIAIPVVKDASTLQYVAKIHHGVSRVPINLVLDLGGALTWVDCDSSADVSSSSRRLIPSQSIQCSRSGKSPVPGNGSDTTTNTCAVFTQNGISGLATTGDLAEDTIGVRSELEDRSITAVEQFLFSCAPTFLLQGLARGARGMLGLGRAPISLPSQLATGIGHQRKFFMCLSSSNGVVLSHLTSTTKLPLMYTPLIGKFQDYFINVKSIKINGNPLSVTIEGLTKLSTIVPYATMESSIYATFAKAFTKAAAAASRDMSVVAPVAPFGLCFSSKGFNGSAVPVIDFVLQSEMVKWRIYGSNSMVKVNAEVVCLGFLDGGSDLTSSIVLGGFQLEDNAMDFDLGTSMLGFSTLRGTCCSDFSPNSVLDESL